MLEPRPLLDLPRQPLLLNLNASNRMLPLFIVMEATEHHARAEAEGEPKRQEARNGGCDSRHLAGDDAHPQLAKRCDLPSSCCTKQHRGNEERAHGRPMSNAWVPLMPALQDPADDERRNGGRQGKTDDASDFERCHWATLAVRWVPYGPHGRTTTLSRRWSGSSARTAST